VDLQAELKISCLKWNSYGTVLAIAGRRILDQKTESNILELRDPYGRQLRSLKLPGKIISGLSWGPNSTRLAITIDSTIYFVNVRLPYVWGICDSGVLATAAWMKNGQNGDGGIIFSNPNDGDRVIKNIGSVIAISGYGDYFAVLSRGEERSKYICLYTYLFIIYIL